MPVQFRAAKPDDARQLAAIYQHAFFEPADETRIAGAMGAMTRRAYVAETTNLIVGFVDGFLTTSQEGTQRWELDLLAVHPDYQGRGIGRNLIQHFTEAGATVGAMLARTLVRVQNAPMHHAVESAGYECLSDICGLYISSKRVAMNETPPDDAHLVPVTTFSYSGLWLEGTITQSAIQAAQNMLRQQQLDVVGGVISLRNLEAIAILQAAGFHQVDQYQWWTRPY